MDEKIKQFDLAMRLAGYNFKKEHVEKIYRYFQLVEDKGEEANLEDMAAIDFEVEKKYKELREEIGDIK